MHSHPTDGAIFRVVASRVIGAAAAVAYGLIADYNGGHQRILPDKYFGNLHATKGGYGDGTEIAFEMYPFGMKRAAQQARARVTEPEPGRVLVETDLDRGFVTTFTVDAGQSYDSPRRVRHHRAAQTRDSRRY